jgi:alkanesulfonate monooxygenase SsuD/methylene tetrahydromethanopterin reductase-like flavin-dependent oxidoreductase (luciferase family)
VKLGVTPWNFSDLSAASLGGQAQLAESLGCHSFWLPENHFNPGAIPDPLMLLASVAGVTQSIRLATTSYLLTLRNPLQAAEQVAVLDQLSGGRVILGVGRGYAADMLAAFKVVPKDKRRIFADTLEIMQQAWSGEPVATGEPNADGEVTTIILDPLPVQRPHPPIWVAAFGPLALAQAGRLGMPYVASPMESLAELEANLDKYRQAGLDAGQTPAAEVPIMRSVFVCNSAQRTTQLRESLASSRLRLGKPEVMPADQWAIVGDAGYVREKIAEYQTRLGMTHLIATRLRVPGLEQPELEGSLATLAELLA